jgi:hypothetical protein
MRKPAGIIATIHAGFFGISIGKGSMTIHNEPHLELSSQE